MKPLNHQNHLRTGVGTGKITNKRFYLYVLVSILVLLAFLSYNHATRPQFSSVGVTLPSTPRDLTTLTHVGQTNIFGLVEGVGAKRSNGWLAKTKMMDPTSSTTRFREYVLPMAARKINVAPYLSEASLADAKRLGIVNELVISQRPSLNSQLIKLMCEIREGLEPKAPSCEKNDELKSVVPEIITYSTKGYGGPVDYFNPLPLVVVRGKGIGRMRSWIGGAAWEQHSTAIMGTYRHTLTSATKGPLWMCTGDHTYWNPLEIENGGKGMKSVTWGIAHITEARRWNKEIANAYLEPLLKLIPTLRVVGSNLISDFKGLAESNIGKSEPNLNPEKITQNGLASEMLLKKVRIWSPLSAPLTERNVQDALLRPSMVCVILTIRSQVKTAMLQHVLWGHQCDEFIVMYTIQDHEENIYGEGLTLEESRLLNATGIHLEHFVKLHSLPPFASQETDGFNLAWYRIRQACEWLDYWTEFNRHQYFYFATESVYAIPENLYALVLSPEYLMLHAAGTPLYAGNRMVAEVVVNHLKKEGTGKDEAEKEPNPIIDTLVVPYIHNGAGVLFSATTIRLLAILLESGDCADGAMTGSPDLFLAQCLAKAGVSPRDTADVLGEDRFHPLSPVEMLAASALAGGNGATESNNDAVFNKDTSVESWWLLQHKPKYLDKKIKENPLRMVSGTSAAFGGILTPEQMVWMHRVLKG